MMNNKILFPILLLVILGVGWAAYDYWYKVPSGPRLSFEEITLLESEIDPQAWECNRQGLFHIGGYFDTDLKEFIKGEDNPTEAVRYFDQAIEVEPNYHIFHVNKATALNASEHYVEAAEAFEKASSLCPRIAEYYVGAGICYHLANQSTKSREALWRGITAYNYRMEKAEFEREKIAAQVQRAFVLFLLGEYRVARRELNNLSEQDPLAEHMLKILKTDDNKKLWAEFIDRY